MNLLIWTLSGLFTGLIVHSIDNSSVKGGLIGSLVLGMCGAIEAGYALSFLTGIEIDGLNPSTVVVAVAGALVLCIIQRTLIKFPKTKY